MICINNLPLLLPNSPRQGCHVYGLVSTHSYFRDTGNTLLNQISSYPMQCNISADMASLSVSNSLLIILYVVFVYSDIDECQSTPCQNGGTCKNQVADYSCDCQNGWTGKNCDVGKTQSQEIGYFRWQNGWKLLIHCKQIL